MAENHDLEYTVNCRWKMLKWSWRSVSALREEILQMFNQLDGLLRHSYRGREKVGKRAINGPKPIVASLQKANQ